MRLNPIPNRTGFLMTQIVSTSRGGFRGFAVALALSFGLSPDGVAAQGGQPSLPEVHNGWSYTHEALSTGVNNGYQLVMDPVNRRVYLTDAQWRTEERLPNGLILPRQSPSGKLVEFDVETRQMVRVHSFLGLTRNDGSGPEGAPFDWSTTEGNSLSSMRTTFSPYGVAVDPRATNAAGQPDPILITTTARGRDSDAGYGGNVVIYRASQGAPTDDDRLFEFEDGTPIFHGIRRVEVNSQTHKAFITNMGSEDGFGGIAVVDLPSKGVDARVAIPGGAIGAAVDEENNLIYVGTMNDEYLYVIDGNRINSSDARRTDLNSSAVTRFDVAVGGNARPTYNAQLKRLYVSTYGNPGTITVIDADPRSAGYGSMLARIETGPTNMVEVDADRGLLYSANLGDQEVVVYDANDHRELLRLPTSGNALNLAVDPVTRDLWVSNFSGAAVVDIFRLWPAR